MDMQRSLTSRSIATRSSTTSLIWGRTSTTGRGPPSLSGQSLEGLAEGAPHEYIRDWGGVGTLVLIEEVMELGRQIGYVLDSGTDYSFIVYDGRNGEYHQCEIGMLVGSERVPATNTISNVGPNKCYEVSPRNSIVQALDQVPATRQKPQHIASSQVRRNRSRLDNEPEHDAQGKVASSQFLLIPGLDS